MHLENTRQNGNHATIRVEAPANGELLGEVPILTAAEVRDCVARARQAQEAWGLLAVEERCARIFTFRDAIVDRADELVALISKENGKPAFEALTHEVLVTADLATYYARRATRILAPREIELHLLKHRRSYVHYAPYGVVGIISPWNFPFAIPVCAAITALVAGNAAIIKPSEQTPLIVLKVKEIWDATGLSPDLFQIVTGNGATGAALIDAGVDKINFTGAVSTGARVAAACGTKLIPCTLELGGKAPLIVRADADIERAARAIVFGGFSNSGQVCIGVERVYAHEEIHDRLLERVVELARRLRQGDPSAGEIDVGAITFPPQMDIVESLVKDAVSKGATVRLGGNKRPGPGRFHEPTILSGCTHDMRVMRDEIFGPIVPFMRFRDDEEALRLANDSHLGLHAYVFTKDRHVGRSMAERIRAGTVMINDVFSTYGAPETPFGGVKQSGWGRVHGDEGLRDMCETRHVNYDRVPTIARDPYWFPYNERTHTAMKKALRLLYRTGSAMQKVRELF